MNFFLILTTECNLRCSYCYGKIWDEGKDEVMDKDIDYFLPMKISYDIRKLAGFCKKDKNCGILLYGGEPLLEMEKLKEVMDNVPAKSFILQTNGILLDKLPEKYIGKLDGLQVSVDGDRITTDNYRGKGTYDKIIANIRKSKPAFNGELIARMTVAEGTDIFKQAVHLIGLGLFDAVHWQVDANFGPDYKKRHFRKWAEESYNPGITKLAELWLSEMRKGNVLRIYPFLGIMDSLLKGEASRLRCGAGWAHYSIQTDGNIAPCPVMAGMKKFYAGNLDSSPNRLKQFDVGEPCTSCKIKSLCGGRCLYGNAHDFWGRKGQSEVCDTVNHLIKEMQSIEPDVKELIQARVVSIEDFDYTKFNSCEIIP